MTNEEKIRDILNRKYGYKIEGNDPIFWTRQYQYEFARLQEMAEWKETQMLAIFDEEMKKQLKNYISYATLENEIQIRNIVNDAIRTIKNKLNING